MSDTLLDRAWSVVPAAVIREVEAAGGHIINAGPLR